MLLGVASLPLSALLQECWVDGWCGVYALMTKATSTAAGGSNSSNRLQQQPGPVVGDEEKVQVGSLDWAVERAQPPCNELPCCFMFMLRDALGVSCMLQRV